MKAGKFVISLFIPFAQPLYSVLLWLLPLVLSVHVLQQWRFTLKAAFPRSRLFGQRFKAMGTPLSVKDRLLIIVFGGFRLMT